MASEKARKILVKMEAPFTEQEIAVLPEGDAWGWIRPRERKLSEEKQARRLPQICFTGFKNSDREKLSHLASQIGFDVKQPVTRQLVILVIGDNLGSSKIEKAKTQGCIIFTENEFMDYFRSKSNGDGSSHTPDPENAS